MATQPILPPVTPFVGIEGGFVIDVERSKLQQEIAARQMLQRSYRYRLVPLQHNHGLPIRFNRPKLTKKQREELRHARIAARRRFKKDHPCPTTPS